MSIKDKFNAIKAAQAAQIVEYIDHDRFDNQLRLNGIEPRIRAILCAWDIDEREHILIACEHGHDWSHL